MRISALAEGSVLGRDVLGGRPDALPLLRAGVRLTAPLIDRLLRAGVHAVYIDDELSAGIIPVPLVTPQTRAQATRAVAGAYGSARRSLLRGRALDKEAVSMLEKIVARLLQEISVCDAAALALDDLACSDAYTFQHSIDVTALGLLIGHEYYRRHGWRDYLGRRRRNDVEDRLFLLGMGLLLHDIGKLAISSDILQKPGRLTDREVTLVRSHPRAGTDLLASGDVSPLIHAVVLGHHERWDGSGYPDGRRGEEIHEMARIAAVADVYDAITSARVYASPRPPHEAVRVILEGSGSDFDPDVVEVFARLIPPFPTGAQIRLSDGRQALVISAPPEQPDRPLVRIIDPGAGGAEVSLLEHPEIAIAGWPQPGPGRRSPAPKRAPAETAFDR